MNIEIKNKLKNRFTDKEVLQIETFLNKGFSENGQIAVTSIFLYSSEHQKSVEDVLSECGKEWERNWQYQHPDIKGDADAPGGAGTQNKVSLENIYSALKIPSPFNTEVPTKAITVTTKNSVYRFSEADKKGKRTISRDENPLDFTQCKILFLAIGKDMELECLDGPHPKWYTSVVRSIK
jgi:hypothetical protein